MELKENEIYYASNTLNGNYIFKANKFGKGWLNFIYPANNTLGSSSNTSFGWEEYDLREATIEEKHWLDECFKACKFISKEEALKTFKKYKYEVEMTDQELLAEARKRYSIDTKFISPENKKQYTIRKETSVNGDGFYTGYSSGRISILCHNTSTMGGEYLYFNGNWAEIVKQEKTETMFKKNDYIVTLKGDFGFSNCGKINYCFKQKEDSSCITPSIDLSGSSSNANYNFLFNKSKGLKDWRYATKQEIVEYDRIGKPYDVTTLLKSESSTFRKDSYVVIRESDGHNSRSSEMVNYCFKLLKDESPPNINCNVRAAGFTFDNSDGGYWVRSFSARKATEKEIAEYQRLDKPYNITTLKEVSTEFVLPGKWCVKPTSSQSEEICNYINKFATSSKYTPSNGENYYWHYPKYDSGNYCYNRIYEGYTQITFEQFKKYVLKTEKSEAVVFDLYSIGDIVVSTQDMTPYRKIGDMFKVLPKSDRSSLWYLSETSNSNSKSWRATTDEEKEAFERGVKNINDIKPKVNYITDKWYKLSDGTYTISSSWYIKFKKLTTENVIVASEYIDGERFRSSEGNFGTIGQYILTEISLSDIQSYLPAEHVDKIKTTFDNFIVGRWSVMSNARGRHYIKVTKIAEKRVDGDAIESSGKYVSNDYWSASTFLEGARLLTDLSEIQSLLPDGHPDKIKKEEKMQFEVGKWYKNLGSNNYYGRFERTDGSYSIWVSEWINSSGKHNNYGGTISCSNAKLADIEEIKKYLPAGHKDLSLEDRLLSEAKAKYPSGTMYICANTGSKHTVIDQSFRVISSETIWGEDGKGCLMYDGKWADIVDNLSNFKVGDWVVITQSSKNWASGMNHLVGKSVKILNISPYGSSISINFEERLGYTWVYGDGHFRRAEAHEIPAEFRTEVWSAEGKGIKRKQPPQLAPIYEVKKVKIIKRTED